MQPSHKKIPAQPGSKKKPLRENAKAQSEASSAPDKHEHTIFGVHAHHQSAVNRLKHTDPDLWNRIRSWN